MSLSPHLIMNAEDLPWLSMPTAWPNEDYEEPVWFASAVTNAVWGDGGSSLRGTRYAMRLQTFVEEREGLDVSAAYVWLGDNAFPPGLVVTECFDATGDEASALAIMGQADEPGAAVEVEAIRHDNLGDGRRYLRRQKVRRGFRSTVASSVRYVWRVQGDVDLRVTFESLDSDRFAAALPDVDRLVRTLRSVSVEESQSIAAEHTKARAAAERARADALEAAALDAAGAPQRVSRLQAAMMKAAREAGETRG